MQSFRWIPSNRWKCLPKLFRIFFGRKQIHFVVFFSLFHSGTSFILFRFLCVDCRPLLLFFFDFFFSFIWMRSSETNGLSISVEVNVKPSHAYMLIGRFFEIDCQRQCSTTQKTVINLVQTSRTIYFFDPNTIIEWWTVQLLYNFVFISLFFTEFSYSLSSTSSHIRFILGSPADDVWLFERKFHSKLCLTRSIESPSFAI